MSGEADRPISEHREPATTEDGLLWKHIRDALRGMQFGTVTLVVQDGLVIQVDRTEKRRLPKRATGR